MHVLLSSYRVNERPETHFVGVTVTDFLEMNRRPCRGGSLSLARLAGSFLDLHAFMVNRPLLAIAIRVLIALATRTFFQPDEYFQSLEVAHHAVFGYGQLTWEWLSPKPIRSIVYPALNIPVYWLLKVLSLDDTAALVCA